MMMLMMSVMAKLTTCSDVPERVEDRQVKLADKVKRFSFALFHLVADIYIFDKYGNFWTSKYILEVTKASIS